jgi:Protein of unknown function (DUF3667)
MTTNVIEDTACLNCGQPLTGAYCAGCGQKKLSLDLTLREFVQETTHELAHWDGKIPSTLKALFFKPGLLTLDFLGGRRARWLMPLRLYLICSIAYFLSGPLMEAITHRSQREMAKITIKNSDGTTQLTPEYREEVAQGWPARLFGMEVLERAAADPAQVNREIGLVLPKAMFLLVPVFAGLTMVMWWRKQPRYPAHLYLALHLHAAWFGALALLTIVVGLIPFTVVEVLAGLATFAYVVSYGILTVRRVFDDSWPITLLKATAVTAVYGVFFFVMSLALLGYVLLRM